MEALTWWFSPLSDISIFIQTRELDDFAKFKHVAYLDPLFQINEEQFKQFPKHSCVILDDFAFASLNKHVKSDFLKIVNYHLRHFNITLILIIHNLYNNNLSNEILLAPHIFLSYSNLGYNIMR